MNRQRRAELNRAIDLIGEAFSIIEECKCEEEEAYDNMPDSLKESDRGEQMYEFIDTMDSVVSSLDEASGLIADIVYA